MRMSHRIGTLGATLILASGLVALIEPVVEAIVGAPATPGSVAGVARRSARRTTVAVASSTPSPPPPPPPPSGMVAALPSGCAPAGDLFRCGNTYYKPYMQGATVVYARVSGP